MIDDLPVQWQFRMVGPLDLDISGTLARELSPGDFGRIVDSFAQDALRLTEEMAAAFGAGDRVALHRAAHGLAGAAASVGAVMLERAARHGLAKGECPPDLIAQVRGAGAEALRALRALVARSDAA